MVIDTSAILCVLFEEESAIWVLEQMESHRERLLMSTVNLTEALIRLRSRLAQSAARLESSLLSSRVDFIAPSIEQARLAAVARLKFPLNLGDCFAYALSATENCPLLALDEDFCQCDRPVLIPPKPTKNPG
jgi:ribonuclease VapC